MTHTKNNAGSYSDNRSPANSVEISGSPQHRTSPSFNRSKNVSIALKHLVGTEDKETDMYLETPDKRKPNAFGPSESQLLFSIRGRIV